MSDSAIDIFVSKSNDGITQDKLGGAIGRVLSKGEMRFSRRSAEKVNRNIDEQKFATKIKIYVNRKNGSKSEKLSHNFSAISSFQIDFHSIEDINFNSDQQNLNHRKANPVVIQLAQVMKNENKDNDMDKFYDEYVENAKSKMGSSGVFPLEIFFEFASDGFFWDTQCMVMKLDEITEFTKSMKFVTMKLKKDDPAKQVQCLIFSLRGTLSFVNSVDEGKSKGGLFAKIGDITDKASSISLPEAPNAPSVIPNSSGSGGSGLGSPVEKPGFSSADFEKTGSDWLFG